MSSSDVPLPVQRSRFDHWVRSRWVAVVCFIAAGLAVYAPVLHGDLLWDDTYLVGSNPFYKSPVFAFEVFRHWLFFDSPSVYYRPVQNLSYMLDYAVWGGNSFGYHLSNVLIHSLSGALLFFLLRRLLPGLIPDETATRRANFSLIAFLVAFVWTLHPIHNAGVAYISGRADSLAALFALAAWLLVCRAREAQQKIARWLISTAAGAAALLALCSKEIALIWLVLFLGHLLFVERRIGWSARVRVVVAVTAVFLAYVFLRSLPEARTPLSSGAAEPLHVRLMLMFSALGDYARLIFWPSQLMMDRTLAARFLWVIGSVTLAVFVILSFWRSRGRGLRVFGTAWFIVAFLPISNLFPLNAQVAEHWIYLASIGFLIFVAGCLVELPVRWQPITTGVISCVALALGVRTAIRASDWADAETFYERTIASSGGSSRILGNLANVYGKRGDFSRQEQLLRETIRRYPGYVPARISLGSMLSRQGRTAEAAEFLNFRSETAAAAIQKIPRTWPIATSVAGVHLREGRAGEALRVLSEARARFPESWDLLKYEADVLQQVRGPGAAIGAVEAYAMKRWWHQESWITLASLRRSAGDFEGATAALRHAARLDIHDARPFAEIAAIELQLNRPEAARVAQQRAIRRDPNQPSRYLVLAGILEQLGDATAAAAAMRQADELRASVQADGA